MDKTIKIITGLLLIVVIVSLNTFTFAKIDTDFYDPNKTPMSNEDKDKVVDMTSSILKYIRYIGIVLSLIVLSIIGLKYILASADEKASYKENMVPYIIGCFLLMGATIIPSIVYQAMN